VPEVGFVMDLLADCSFREVFLDVTGILPDIYLAARPAPGLMGGKRRAMMDVERGMMVVSSSYAIVSSVSNLYHWFLVSVMLTFVAIFVINCKVEICSTTKATLDDYITLELKYGDTSSVKLHSRWLFLGLELEEY
jgi:hypothetical protein